MLGWPRLVNITRRTQSECPVTLTVQGGASPRGPPPSPLCPVVTKKSRERKPRPSLPSRLRARQVVSGAAVEGCQSPHRFTVNLP